MSLVLIGLGGFAGAVARYLVDTRIVAATGTGLPWGTFVINVSGSFAAGMLFAIITERAVLPQELRSPLMIGFLGSFTTFSTLMLDAWRTFESGAWLSATMNVAGSLLVGLVAVAAGVAIGRAL